jgi:hypothetical protein
VDNIQKSVVAVLCVAAFAALIIPSGISFNADKQVAPEATVVVPQTQAVQAPVETSEEASDEYASQDDAVEGPDEYETFGQPMNDALPLGASANLNQAESPQSNLPAGALNGSSTVGQNYADQVAGAPIRTNQPVE